MQHQRLLYSFQALKEAGIPYSRSHLWRLVKAGTFPKPIKLGASRIAWRASDLHDWLDSKEQEEWPISTE